MPYTNLTRFDFLIVLIGIIVGMSLTKIISFIGLLLSERRRYKVHWVPLLYLLILFVAQIHYWWSLWQADKLTDAGFLQFLHLLVLPVIYYLCSAILCPEFDDAFYDLKQRFHDQARLLYAVMLSGILVSVVQAPLVWGVHLGSSTLICRYLGIAVLVTALLIRGHRHHGITAILISVALTVFLWVSLR